MLLNKHYKCNFKNKRKRLCSVLQCEQTIRTPAGNGCAYAQGMCGKTAETSDLQDLLVAALQGLSARALQARSLGIVDHQIDSFAPRAFFSTLTNVNFDSQRIIGYARETPAAARFAGRPLPAAGRRRTRRSPDGGAAAGR